MCEDYIFYNTQSLIIGILLIILIFIIIYLYVKNKKIIKLTNIEDGEVIENKYDNFKNEEK